MYNSNNNDNNICCSAMCLTYCAVRVCVFIMIEQQFYKCVYICVCRCIFVSLTSTAKINVLFIFKIKCIGIYALVQSGFLTVNTRKFWVHESYLFRTGICDGYAEKANHFKVPTLIYLS